VVSAAEHCAGTMATRAARVHSRRGAMAAIRIVKSSAIQVRCCEWSLDSARVLSASQDRTIRVWDVQTTRCLHTIVGHSGLAPCICDPPNWRAFCRQSFHSECEVEGHKDVIVSCLWSPDEAMVLSGSLDRTVKVWDATCGRCLATQHHTRPVKACGWAGRGEQVLVCLADSVVSIFNVSASAGRCSLEPAAELALHPMPALLCACRAPTLCSPHRKASCRCGGRCVPSCYCGVGLLSAVGHCPSPTAKSPPQQAASVMLRHRCDGGVCCDD